MKRLFPWLMIVGLLVVMFGTMYVAVQQSQRSDANSPQIQLAEDAATALNLGDSPAAVIGSTVDMSKSLAPFMIVFDKSGKAVAGSGYLDGTVPKVPVGVLTASKGKDYHAVTWQPQPGVRIAAVTVSAKNYYVLSGRSLTEVEKNETRTLQISLLGGVVALMLLGTVFVLGTIHGGY
jgi:hypothetical protein